MDPHTRTPLEAPITITLLRLATMLVMVVQTAIGLGETYFIGRLGTDALAGVVLVAFGLITAAAVAGGAWFGSLTWPWSTAAALQRRSPT
jgi:Na+-driven multidrug efflux pump